jgi:hypothetical protein
MDMGSGLVGVQSCLELSHPKCSTACAEPGGDLQTRSRVAQTGPQVACDSADAFAASAFAPTSHGIKSSVSADWRDHAGANPLSSRPRSISRQLRDWSSPYSCPAFRGKCRTADGSKGRLVVFLVRISKIYTSGIRIRTDQECFGDPLNPACFHTVISVLSHKLTVKILKSTFLLKKNAGRRGGDPLINRAV